MLQKIGMLSIILLALTIAPSCLSAQDFSEGTDNLSRFGISSQDLTPEKLKILKRQTGMDNSAKEQQTATHPDLDQTEENEKSKINLKLTPPEKSTAEKFFARPETSVGQAVGGPALPKDEKKLSEEEAKQKETEQEALLAYLLSAQEKLVGYEKIDLFLKLDPERRQKYLQQLPLRERETLLNSLGEKGRYYSGDLQVKPVDRELKQFGYDFFENKTGGFTPDNQAPVGPDYVVGPGDTFVVSIWGNIDGSYEVSVDRSGDIVLPKVGAIHLWGQTFTEAKETIHRQVAKYFTNFQMNVTLGALRSIQVYLVGEVKAPGSYTVSSLSTVLSALVAAGGPAKTGSLRNVQLVRGGEAVANIDFYDFFLNGDRSRDARLQSGDTIHVPVVGPLVGLAGDVRHPAIFELKDGETLQDALRMTGGIISTAYLKRVQVERVVAHQKKMALDLDLSHLGEQSKANTFALQDRDLVKVSPISPASASYVVLDGYAARPGRYQFVPGMRLADLITPYDNLLPETFRGMAEILRLQPPSYQPEKLTIELGKALSGDPQQNILLQEFDEVRLFSRDEMEEIPQVEIVGAVLNPGIFRLYKNMTVRDLVVAAGNVKRSAYLGEAELTRYIPTGKGTRIERFDIGLDKALAGNPEQDLILQPYDHLVVRAIPDLIQRRTIEVKGKVLFPGIYTIAKGEKLSSVLTRAGGFADGAYLLGALFSRESAKQIQTERLNQLIFEQEQEASRAAAEIAAGALSAEEAKSAEAILASRKAIIDKLKQIPITGRMVVHLAPLGTFTGSRDDFEVMDGDRITIPENPKSVAVIGQVYNPISLAYQPGKSVSYYLAKVGGTTENANTDQIYIVRADGTVYSKQQAGTGVEWDSENHRWVFGGFNATDLYPGDTVLVPEKIKKTDIMREIKDITTIFYQLGLGAAAISVL